MKTLKKYNYATNKFSDHIIEDNWNCKAYSHDMEEVVNCPHCGRQLTYGDTYTSLEIRTPMGFGYGVCENCYSEELRRMRNAQTEREKQEVNNEKQREVQRQDYKNH